MKKKELRAEVEKLEAELAIRYDERRDLLAEIKQLKDPDKKIWGAGSMVERKNVAFADLRALMQTVPVRVEWMGNAVGVHTTANGKPIVYMATASIDEIQACLGMTVAGSEKIEYSPGEHKIVDRAFTHPNGIADRMFACLKCNGSWPLKAGVDFGPCRPRKDPS